MSYTPAPAVLLSAATYSEGGPVTLKVELTANHGGKFFFRICNRSTNLDEACFGTNFLTRRAHTEEGVFRCMPAGCAVLACIWSSRQTLMPARCVAAHAHAQG